VTPDSRFQNLRSSQIIHCTPLDPDISFQTTHAILKRERDLVADSITMELHEEKRA
jgi:hypothetical protein